MPPFEAYGPQNFKTAHYGKLWCGYLNYFFKPQNTNLSQERKAGGGSKDVGREVQRDKRQVAERSGEGSPLHSAQTGGGTAKDVPDGGGGKKQNNQADSNCKLFDGFW